MKLFLLITTVAVVASGCIWDHASVEPRTVIGMHRVRTNAASLAGADAAIGATPLTQTNGLANDQGDFGVAPYVSQTALGGDVVGTNAGPPSAAAPSATVPAARLPPIGTTGAGSSAVLNTTGISTVPGNTTGISSSPGTAPGVTGGAMPITGTTTPAGLISGSSSSPPFGSTPGISGATGPGTGVSGGTGSSLGTGLGSASSGSAIGLPSNTITGLTNNLLTPTNLFGPRP